MTRRRTAIGLTLVAAGSLAFLWLTNVPLGVPGEWTWDRIPTAGNEWPALLLGWLSALVIGGLYFTLVLFAAPRLESAVRWQVAVWLAALCGSGFAWLWAVQESPAQVEYGMTKTAWALYFKGPEGYFDQARYEMRDVSSYLANYEQLMAQGDVLHLGTHPPGLILFHRACLDVCSASDALRDILLRTQPASFRDALDETERLNRGTPREITSSDRAALWLAALVTQIVAAATVFPIYLLVRRSHSRPIAWLTCAIWPLVPALAIFLPKSDALFPFFGMLFLWLWLEGFRTGRLSYCLTAGLLFWCSMFLSLAILPVAAAAGLLTLWEGVLCSRVERVVARPRDWLLRIGAAALGWAIPVAALALFGGVNLLNVWRWNYRNHAGFYDHFTRSYWPWLAVNPIELVFALGAPLALAALIGIWCQLRADWRSQAAGPAWCLTAVWILLWLSGKNMGEAARLWLILMPWAVWLAAGYVASLCDSAPADRANPGVSSRASESLAPTTNRLAMQTAALLLGLQLLVCLGTVTRVTGFRWN